MASCRLIGYMFKSEVQVGDLVSQRGAEEDCRAEDGGVFLGMCRPLHSSIQYFQSLTQETGAAPVVDVDEAKPWYDAEDPKRNGIPQLLQPPAATKDYHQKYYDKQNCTVM